MIITNIKASRGESDGESIKFSMMLKEFKAIKLFSVSTDFIYTDGSIKDSISKLTANVSKQGLTQGIVNKANEMIRTMGLQQ